MKKLFLLIFFGALTACTINAPLPGDENYSKSIANLPAANKAVYISDATWYPNILLGSFFSFEGTRTGGRLFFAPDKLVFAIYDDVGRKYVGAHEIQISEIEWLEFKPHGLATIINIKTNNSLQAFAYFRGDDMQRNTVDTNVIKEYLISRHAAERKG